MQRRLPLLLAALVLAGPATAGAEVTPFGKLACSEPTAGGPRFCGAEPSAAPTHVPTFDSVPLDTNVALPPAAAGDGPFPLLVVAHGYGGQKDGFDDRGSEGGYVGTLQELAAKGYAVLSFTSRGFGDSCGSRDTRLQNPSACAGGFIRLDDYRFEAMDVAYLSALLVDQGVARPGIGIAGPSYAGGLSLELAVLKNRMCDDLYVGGGTAQHECRTLVPWVTPNGTAMSVAAAAPLIPWSDLVYSLLPNGRTLDYTVANPYVSKERPGDSASPVGVLKQSFVAGLYALGQTSGYYQPSPAADTTDRRADLTTWFGRVNAGEPYDDRETKEIVDLVARYRSPYNLPFPADGPAPLFIANGWTDDLFPPTEALRFYNRVRRDFPAVPISLLFADHGHQRASQGTPVYDVIRARVQGHFDRHLLGDASAPAPTGVEAYLTACPVSKEELAAGPFRADTWPQVSPGEVRFLAKDPAAVPPQGDPREDRVSDPIANGSNPCSAVPSTRDAPATATYRLPKVAADGYTLLGAPTVAADVTVAGGPTQLDARLWDVAPDGSEILVSKAIYRLTASGAAVFQLQHNGWRFAAGHTPRLQLLTSDAPYARRSNARAAVSVANLRLRLPVAEEPDCDQVLSPAAPILPAEATGLSRDLARGVSATATGPCGSAGRVSEGASPGTAGGEPIAGSSGRKARARIVFGNKRYRSWRSVRRRGIPVRISCTADCRARGSLKYGLLRVGKGRRAGDGRFVLRVRVTRRGARRLAKTKDSRVRLTVAVRDRASGARLKRRTGGFVIRPPHGRR